VHAVHQRTVPLADLFDISESDTVWDAWLNTVTLLDILDNIQQISQYYDKKNMKCFCGLSDGEHALLKRKIMRFFKLQVANLKHFVY
jgi:hypothetical protein